MREIGAKSEVPILEQSIYQSRPLATFFRTSSLRFYRFPTDAAPAHSSFPWIHARRELLGVLDLFFRHTFRAKRLNLLVPPMSGTPTIRRLDLLRSGMTSDVTLFPLSESLLPGPGNGPSSVRWLLAGTRG